MGRCQERRNSWDWQRSETAKRSGMGLLFDEGRLCKTELSYKRGVGKGIPVFFQKSARLY